MAVIFRDDFTGSSGTDLAAHTPDVGTAEWKTSVGQESLELDGSGFAIHDYEASQNLACRSYAETFDPQTVVTLEAQVKIVGPPEGWGQGELTVSLGDAVDPNGNYLGVWFYTPNTSGTGTVYVDYIYGTEAYSGSVIHTETVTGLSVSDLILAKVEYDSDTAELLCYRDGNLVSTLDASSVGSTTLSKIALQARRTWWTSPYSNVFALDYVEITDGQADAVPTYEYTASEIAGYAFRCFADALVDDTPIRIPISSWQATLRNDGSNYAQIVVPTAAAWADTLDAATEIIITYALCDDAGTATDELEVCRFPPETLSYAQGVRNDTVTVSGYWDGYDYNADPAIETNRDLTGVQQAFSTTNTLRYRCKLDPLLRPSVRAYPDGYTAILVTYVNFYVGQQGAFMDVGGLSRTTYTGTAVAVASARGSSVPLALVTGIGTSVGAGPAAAVDAT